MCRKCGKSVEILQVYRDTVCPHCGRDLHSCVNCSYYSPGSHYDCHETVDELVSDKERANFCDSFKFKNYASGSAESDKAASARDAFNSLFG